LFKNLEGEEYSGRKSDLATYPVLAGNYIADSGMELYPWFQDKTEPFAK